MMRVSVVCIYDIEYIFLYTICIIYSIYAYTYCKFLGPGKKAHLITEFVMLGIVQPDAL